tara:strand:+ start:247 stop:861 length:615 start_codon:yes stop_codon:yes gene_type:complete
MLDDCTIDEKQFGYIAQNPEIDSIDGWPQPSSFGVLCSIDDLWERGTNIIFTAKANQRFELLEVVQSALPSIPFGDIYPTVDDLVDQYIEHSPQGKLYLRATIRLLDDLEGECSSEDWSSFLHDWADHIIDVNSIFSNMDIDFDQVISILEKEFLLCDTHSLWQVAHTILDKQDDRQSALSSSSFEEVFSILRQVIPEKNTPLD